MRGKEIESSRPIGPGIFHACILLGLVVLLAAAASRSEPEPAPSAVEFSPGRPTADLLPGAASGNEDRFGGTESGGAEQGTPGSTGGFGNLGGGAGDSAGGGADSVEDLALDRRAEPRAAGLRRDGARTGAGDESSFGPPAPQNKRCMRYPGAPPQQIEDPQSPPCVSGSAETQAGGNGGSTWEGVTSNQIRIAWPETQVSPVAQAIQNFFNSRFEFHSRTFTLVPCPAATLTESEQKAAAVKLDAQCDVFASMPYPNSGGVFYDELAGHKIVSVASSIQVRTENQLLAAGPYRWSYIPPLETIERNLSEFVCNQLVQSGPEWAGVDVQATSAAGGGERVFGFANRSAAPEADLTLIKSRLNECGAGPSPEPFPELGPGGVGGTGYEKPMADMAALGVTTIICFCSKDDLFFYGRAASAIQYHPEWIFNSFINGDSEPRAQVRVAPDQLAHTFAQGFRNMMVSTADLPASWALREGSGGSLYWTNSGVFTPDELAHNADDAIYKPMLVLAAGIQMAGPDLTPEHFAQGLAQASQNWPNPATVYKAAKVDFRGRNWMNSDAAIMWWDSAAESKYDPPGPGGWCYVMQGKRWNEGELPDRRAGEGKLPLFDPPCR